MKHPRRIGLVLALLTTLWVPAHARPLSLYTSHSPPYQEQHTTSDGARVVRGTTVDTVRCITDELGWRAHISLVPQNRAIHALRNRIVDGYFGVDISGQLDQFASHSAPIALEKWYFYSERPVDDYGDTRIAAIAGSNEAHWLEQTRYPLAMTVARPSQLLALLHHGRVDVILMDQRMMALEQAKGPRPIELHGEFVRFTPLTLYVTQDFSLQYPVFIPQFNQRIGGCLQGGFALTEEEHSALGTKALALMHEIQNSLEFDAILRQQRVMETLDQTLALDSEWRAQAPQKASARAREILMSPTSVSLARWQHQQDGLVTEIILADRKGSNVAISQLTSDYWQGDEAKFEKIFEAGEGALHLSSLRFDPSSQGFQVIASTPIHDDVSGQFLGVLVIGLDIEKALRSSHLRDVEE